MTAARRWVLLAYRLPREPSTPRIAIWRQLRRLGALQLADGVVALPLDARTREQLEWIAQAIDEASGEATIWLAQPSTAAQDRALVDRMLATVAEEYRDLESDASAAGTTAAGGGSRTVGRLRRELRRIRGRDYFRSPLFERARAAVESAGRETEVVS
jgi:hypothetical protein